MLEFKGLFAVGAFEFAEAGALVVTDHVALEAIDVGKILLAYYAGLSGFGKETHKKHVDDDEYRTTYIQSIRILK